MMSKFLPALFLLLLTIAPLSTLAAPSPDVAGLEARHHKRCGQDQSSCRSTDRTVSLCCNTGPGAPFPQFCCVSNIGAVCCTRGNCMILPDGRPGCTR
ncbi:hypothetical protein DFH27DRAFT_386855 [Peziza echinospora]|nr:hypothetical protein DFH27DRAFT_386855 [Peziza echinospora]